MFTAKLNPHQKTAFALALLILCIITLIVVCLLPLVHSYSETQQTIAQLQLQLQRYNEKINSRASVIQQTAALKKHIEGTGVFSMQKSAPLVLADLQQTLKDIITDAGGELTTTQNMAVTPLENLVKLGVKVNFSAQMAALKKILYQIESIKPYMIIETIKIYPAAHASTRNSSHTDTANRVAVVADIITYTPPLIP